MGNLEKALEILDKHIDNYGENGRVTYSDLKEILEVIGGESDG